MTDLLLAPLKLKKNKSRLSNVPFTVAHFVDRVLAYPQGRIVLCNVLDGLDQGLFDGHFVREVLDWWRALFLERVNNIWRRDIDAQGTRRVDG